jgi:predicted nucleotidyltransferase
MLTSLFGSRLRARLLGWLFSHPDERFFVRQLTGLLDEDPTNVSRELARLEKMGILVSLAEGRQKYYQVDRECSVFHELHGLVLKTIGVADVLRQALSPLEQQISIAFVFGSMASGEATSASDADLLVVGDIDEVVLHKAVAAAEQRLGRTVNYTLVSEREFQRRRREKNGFLAQVLNGPKIMILGSEREVRPAAGVPAHP